MSVGRLGSAGVVTAYGLPTNAGSARNAVALCYARCRLICRSRWSARLVVMSRGPISARCTSTPAIRWWCVSEFVYDREDVTVIVLRVPRAVWDRWEFRHGHYGKAIHALRESCVEIMAAKAISTFDRDHGDPFFRG